MHVLASFVFRQGQAKLATVPIKNENGKYVSGTLSYAQGATMKIGKRTGIMLLAVVLLTGCGSFWNVLNTGGGGCTTNCTTLTSGVFYVLNSSPGQVEIVGSSISGGTLNALAGSPYSVPSGPYAIAVAPNNNFLYVSTQSGIYLYTIGTGGELKLASATPVAADFSAVTMQVDATNSWLVEASGTGYLYAIPIKPSDGTVTGAVQQVTLAGITAHQLAISPDNTKIFVTLGGVGTAVIPFAAASADPLPATISTAPIAVKEVGGSAVSVAVDPINRLLYIGETLATSGSSNTGGLRAFNYSSLSGVPTELAGSPFASGGLAPVSILATSSGAYVYVANATVSNSTTGNISGFTVIASGTTYSLTALSSTASAGTTPAGMAEDSTSAFLLLVNSGGGPDLEAYTFDTTTPGKLDSSLTSSTGTDPVGARAIAAAP
jgi:6-phosphogluconolactonase (cycloisomerase 2 family)